ncbi:MAG: hypothetical protein IKR78_03725 [Dehalococcoidales bacterium]|nr:hypothetical protein [Dehalococcoidales bacterium]
MKKPRYILLVVLVCIFVPAIILRLTQYETIPLTEAAKFSYPINTIVLGYSLRQIVAFTLCAIICLVSSIWVQINVPNRYWYASIILGAVLLIPALFGFVSAIVLAADLSTHFRNSLSPDTESTAAIFWVALPAIASFLIFALQRDKTKDTWSIESV